MYTKLEEAGAAGNKADQFTGRYIGGGFAWRSTKSKDLEPRHCLCQADDGVVIYPRGAATITGELYLKLF